MRYGPVVALALGLLATACGGGEDGGSPTTSAAVSTAAPDTASTGPTDSVTASTIEGSGETTSTFGVPEVLAGFERGIIEVGGVQLYVAMARSRDERVQGLMRVADLGPLDGMLFVWEEDTATTFWMSDTWIPLDIAWFDGLGRFVSSATMTPCEPGTTCTRYAASRAYRYALEVPAGDLEELGRQPVLVIDPGA